MDLKGVLDPNDLSGLSGPETVLTDNKVTIIVGISLLIIGTASSLDVAGEFMGRGKTTAFKYLNLFLSAVKVVYRNAIRLPSSRKMDEEADLFESNMKKNGALWVPRITGAVDGTHIFIDKPCHNAEAFWSYKHRHSVVVQVIDFNLEYSIVLWSIEI